MRLLLSTAILTLAWFSATSLLASGVTWILAAVLRLRGSGQVSRPRARVLLCVRLLPFAASALLAFGLFLPEHWVNEARDGSEHFGAVLWTFALLGLALIGASSLRVLAALRTCHQLRQSWKGRSLDDRRIVNDAALPGVSLAGILRTTIVVGHPVREALTGEELDLALAHELAHRDAWDNVKRFAMFASPDFFRHTAAARRLEGQWNAEVECLADAQAVQGDPSKAALLASALVKVARLAAAAPRHPAMPPNMPLWSTFYESALLEVRVRRLVAGPTAPGEASWITAMGAVAAVAAVFTGAWLESLPRLMHFMTETLVRLLP